MSYWKPTDYPSASPCLVCGDAEVGLSHAHVHLYVPDCRAVYDRAVAAGAETIQEPQRKADDDDFRSCVRDPSGTTS